MHVEDTSDCMVPFTMNKSSAITQIKEIKESSHMTVFLQDILPQTKILIKC